MLILLSWLPIWSTYNDLGCTAEWSQSLHTSSHSWSVASPCSSQGSLCLCDYERPPPQCPDSIPLHAVLQLANTSMYACHCGATGKMPGVCICICLNECGKKRHLNQVLIKLHSKTPVKTSATSCPTLCVHAFSYAVCFLLQPLSLTTQPSQLLIMLSRPDWEPS